MSYEVIKLKKKNKTGIIRGFLFGISFAVLMFILIECVFYALNYGAV